MPADRHATPLPQPDADGQLDGTPTSSLPSAAELTATIEGVLRRGDGSVLRLEWSDACRYVGVSPATVELVWAAVRDRLMLETVGLWSSRQTADLAGVSDPQARRSMRLLAAFGLLERRRRFNRSSLTALTAATAGGGLSDVTIADALRTVQSRLAEFYGGQVHGAGWGAELAAALSVGIDGDQIVARLTEHMGELDDGESRVRVARWRLRDLAGLSGADDLSSRGSRSGRAVDMSASSARNERDSAVSDPFAREARAIGADSPTVLSARSPASPDMRHELRHVRSGLSEPAGHGQSARPPDVPLPQAGRATTKKEDSLGKKDDGPPPLPSGPRDDVPIPGRWAANLASKAQAAGVTADADTAARWIGAASTHGLSVRDLMLGLFEGLADSERRDAVVAWRLRHPDGHERIRSAADTARRKRRAAAAQRHARWLTDSQRRAAERAHNQFINQLEGTLGEPPVPQIVALAATLPAIEHDLESGQSPPGLILARVDRALTSKNETVARQAARIVSETVARRAGRARTDSPERTADDVSRPPDDDVEADSADGRLFRVE